eukprot:gnl/MRDRNA2_/MRDRNA2_80621_c0_seq2.p1 gnl/MRDRNA2_/MRDRNA2_80621_c0~~gnl/MRDRNA2_/MRDRNA2_80621_c0_seq2.p1  ORF type:complete len:124 (+),score=16.44 gnl/MRDRNA2_/MRDRNA2_80621_c0_seq2:235-606(+)
MALVDVAEGIHWVDFVNSVVLLSGTGMMHTRSGDALPCMHSCTAPANELNADLSSLVVEFRMRCLGPIISKLRQAAEHVTGSIGMQRLRDASGPTLVPYLGPHFSRHLLQALGVHVSSQGSRN